MGGTGGKKKSRDGWDVSHLLVEPLAPGTAGTEGSKYGTKTPTETSQPSQSDPGTLSLLRAGKGFCLPE